MIVVPRHRKCLKIALAAIQVALLNGTAFAADKSPPAGLPYSRDQFHEAPADTAPKVTVPADSSAWWSIFGDPKLDALIAKAQINNGDIALAAARLSQARAELRLAKVEQRPQASFGGNASRQTGPLINAAGGGGTLLSVGATIAYELDVLGRLSKTKKAARLDAEAADKLVQSARLMVAADVAQAYFELLTLDEERALLREAIAGEEQALTIVKARIANGFAAELEESRARGQLATVKSELSEVERRRAEVEHGLSFLMGDATDDLGIAGQRLDRPPSIPADIPSVVLARRPDVAAADRKLAAATTRVGVAKTSWLPQLSLTTSRGYASSSLSTLLKTATQNFGLGFLLSLPFLDGGRRAAAIRRANADVELSAAEYRVQILTALREVEDQLSAVRILGEQADALGEAGAANSRAKAITQSRFTNGLISQLEMLEAGRTQLESARDAVRNKFARYVATIGLVRALGGGWTNPADKLRLGATTLPSPSVETASQ
jgi:outer membrane protein, multidrug efflux system